MLFMYTKYGVYTFGKHAYLCCSEIVAQGHVQSERTHAGNHNNDGSHANGETLN